MKGIAIFVLLATLNLTVAYADTSGLVKLQTNENGLLEIPADSDAFWILLNDCRIDKSGVSSGKEPIYYRPQRYGDIFFVESFSGDAAEFAAQLTYLGLIDRKVGCVRGGQPHLPPITAFQAASEVASVYSQVNKDRELAVRDFIARLPTRPGAVCPTSLAGRSDLDKLEGCLDLAEVSNQVSAKATLLQQYPTPPISPRWGSTAYSYRKQFSTLTVKSSFAVAPYKHTALATAYISVYPLTQLIQSERWSVLDRISMDIGVAKPIGDTAPDEFTDASNHYMLGAGLDLAEGFSIHAADVMYFDKGKTHHTIAFGVSVDVLSMLAKLN